LASTCAAWIEAVPYTELPENRPGLAIVRALQRGRRANAKLFSLCARGNLSKNVQKRRAPVEGCAAPQNLEEPGHGQRLSEGGKPLLEFLIGFVEPSMVLAKVSEN
jgi:hypothetical protein